MGWKSGQRIAISGIYHTYSIKIIDFQNEFSLFVSLAMDQTICINCIRNHDGSDQCHSIWNALSGREKDFSSYFTNTRIIDFWKFRFLIIIHGRIRMR